MRQLRRARLPAQGGSGNGHAAGARLSAGRAVLGPVHHSLTSSDERTISAPAAGAGFFPEPTRPQVATSDDHTVAVVSVGADVAVAATTPLAVPPPGRARVINGALGLRPGHGRRWAF